MTGTRTGVPVPGPLLRWVVGARPRTLPAAVVPVAVGTAVAWWAGRRGGVHPVTWWRCGAALVVALGMQVGVNYANDYSDGIRGTDEQRVGPLRLVASGLASPRAVRRAAWAAMAVSAAAGLVLAAAAGWWLVGVGAACIAAGWLYTGGPAPYGYLGLGELFVFVFFGVVATVGTTYVAIGAFPAAGVVASVVTGLLACALLEANNLRDLPGDAASGKATAAVRLGRRRAGRLYAATLALAATAVVVTGVLWVPWVVLALAGAPLAVGPLRLALSGADGRDLVPALAGSARLQAVAGGLLALGFVLGGAAR